MNRVVRYSCRARVCVMCMGERERLIEVKPTWALSNVPGGTKCPIRETLLGLAIPFHFPVSERNVVKKSARDEKRKKFVDYRWKQNSRFLNRWTKHSFNPETSYISIREKNLEEVEVLELPTSGPDYSSPSRRRRRRRILSIGSWEPSPDIDSAKIYVASKRLNERISPFFRFLPPSSERNNTDAAPDSSLNANINKYSKVK